MNATSDLPFRGAPPDRDDWLLAQGFSFNPDRWQARLPPGLWPPLLDACPTPERSRWPRVTRRDVFAASADADIPAGALSCYVATAVWGTGTSAQGVARRVRPVSDAGTAERTGRHLAEAVQALRAHGPVAGYERLHGAGNVIKDLGPSFGTKVLYFACWDHPVGDRRPLILDQYVAVALHRLTGEPWPAWDWTGDQYATYLDLAHHWAEHWGCEPDVIERVLFSIGKAPPLAVATLTGLPPS